MTTFRKADRVVPSGEGRTAAWPKTPGTVTRKLSKTSVEVVWDGTSFGDEMELAELVKIEGRRVFTSDPTIRLYDAGAGRLVTIPEND